MTPMLHGRPLEAVHGAASSRARSGLTADWVQPHFDPMTKAVTDGAGWARAEPAYRYGFGARLQYGSEYAKWSDGLEQKLAAEWVEEQTGQTFASVVPFVRQGFEAARR